VVEAPGFSPAKTGASTNGFSHGEPGLKALFSMNLTARLKPCPSTESCGHFFCRYQ